MQPWNHTLDKPAALTRDKPANMRWQFLANAFGAADTESDGLDVLFDFFLVIALDVGHKFTAMELNLFVRRIVSHSLVG
jgi:hypothetical protein